MKSLFLKIIAVLVGIGTIFLGILALVSGSKKSKIKKESDKIDKDIEVLVDQVTDSKIKEAVIDERIQVEEKKIEVIKEEISKIPEQIQKASNDEVVKKAVRRRKKTV